MADKERADVITAETIREHLDMMATALHVRKPPLGFKWPTVYEFVLRNGIDMSPVVLAKRLGPMKLCYATATRTVANHHGDNLVYCEGFAIPNGLFPMEHAWIYDTDERRVIETTWTKPGTEYFGIAFKKAFLRKSVLNRKYFGLIGDWQNQWPILRMTQKQLEKAIHPLMKQ